MVQAGVGAFPTAPGFPPAGAQTSGGAPSGANAGVGSSSDGTGLSSMVAKNAAVVAAAAAAAAHAAQDSQLQHHMKQDANNGAGLATHSQVAVVGTQVR